MALHTFEADVTLTARRYNAIVRRFKKYGEAARRPQESLVPSFHIGRAVRRIGEIVFTHATEEEFAGVLCVGDGPRDQRIYEMLLINSGVTTFYDVPLLSSRSHLIAGRRSDDSEDEFSTVSVVRGMLQGQSQDRAENTYQRLVSPHTPLEFRIKPQDVYDIARMLQPPEAT